MGALADLPPLSMLGNASINTKKPTHISPGREPGAGQALQAYGEEGAVNKGEGTAEKAVDVLIAMFDSQDIRSELDDATRNGIREIGQSLYEAGGMDLMLAAHEMFEAQRRLWARTLEMQWDGIGGWWG